MTRPSHRPSLYHITQSRVQVMKLTQ